jgi:hypothetical protein
MTCPRRGRAPDIGSGPQDHGFDCWTTEDLPLDQDSGRALEPGGSG